MELEERGGFNRVYKYDLPDIPKGGGVSVEICVRHGMSVDLEDLECVYSIRNHNLPELPKEIDVSALILMRSGDIALHEGCPVCEQSSDEIILMHSISEVCSYCKTEFILWGARIEMGRPLPFEVLPEAKLGRSSSKPSSEETYNPVIWGIILFLFISILIRCVI
jgi:hypothetical protein